MINNTDSTCLAIITARGGSKRIPRKNIKEFLGKPIMAYSIDAALKSGVFDEVMVSTDDEDIRDIALRYGASVPFMRSEKTSNDMAMTHEVIIEVLEEYEKIGKTFEFVCCIYPTAPFITAEKLREGKSILEKEDVDAVVPVVAFSFPPQRAFVIRDNSVKFNMPENRLVRSQDLEKWYHDCGQFYFLRTKQFLAEKNLIMERTAPMIMDELEVQDIDNYDDWKIAELKMQLMIDKENAEI